MQAQHDQGTPYLGLSAPDRDVNDAKMWLMVQAEAGDPDAAVPMELGMRPEALDEQQIELLIHEQVHQKLQVILEGEMALALQDFVDKVSAIAATLPNSCRVCFVHNTTDLIADTPVMW